ncbi:oxygenase MpaB family protein [Nocardia arizonensis]|uniref:oxygenase MpaB family protein n=1 Tax=Nocardia arizonensis TaxID=1141647 RepID=UPI0012E1D4A4|nr:oxygenase MpaB family protein [Nocardia arizonensis]
MWTDRVARLSHPYRVRDELATLDPVIDNERMTHLVLEVRYGHPWFVTIAYTLAFLRQMSIPAIARTVYRAGTGDIMRATRRRNDDTLVFFGEIMRCGYTSARGGEVIDRLNEIHARYRISNDLNVYTLASLILEAQRIGLSLDRPLMSEREMDAVYHFWHGVGTRMGITDIPGSSSEFLTWTLQYERDNAAYTPGGHAVAQVIIDDFAARFPRPLRRAGTAVLLSLCDDGLLDAHRLTGPSRAQRSLALAAMRGYLLGTGLLPDPGERSWVDWFGRDTAYPDFTRIGQQRERRAAADPR